MRLDIVIPIHVPITTITTGAASSGESKQKVELKVPRFFKDSILVINNGSLFLKIDKSSGRIQQEIKTKGEAFISGVTVYKDAIFYSCYGGNVVKCTE